MRLPRLLQNQNTAFWLLLLKVLMVLLAAAAIIVVAYYNHRIQMLDYQLRH